MFSLLNPLGLWLAAALAVPLAIHFLGRQRLRKQPFPSLLLLREKLSKSMRRHRLKNLLLLLLRTLLILALLLALAEPALETRRPSGTSDAVAVLVHNGAYGLLREDGNSQVTVLQGQLALVRGLDSASGSKASAVPLIADGPGLSEAVARLGDYGEAVPRLLAALGGAPGATQIHVPVFAWADLMPAKAALEQGLRDHPGLQVVLWDFGTLGERLSAFSDIKATPSPQAPTVRLRARLNPAAGSLSTAKAGKVQTYLGKSLFQEGDAQGITEVTLPLDQGPRTWGRLSFVPSGAFAANDWHFCFPNPGRLTLEHAGTALASLPSLGRENYFRRVVHVAAAKDLPLGAENGGHPPRLIYLSDEKNTDAAVYGRIVEFVKRGGRVIIGVGRESEVPMINRFLLQPLRLGRLGDVAETAGPVEAHRPALARLGALPETGPLGAVRKRFAFAPDSGAETLLSQGKEPILVARDFHQGKAMLWTTDIDDLDWTDLGVRPFTPLLHQAFQEAGGDGAEMQGVASDSVYVMALDNAGSAPQVIDPEGRPFTRVRMDGARLRIGPFDKPGLHRVIAGRDTVAFAVNLARTGPGPEDGRGPETGPAGKPGDWGQWNRAAREELLKGLEGFGNRVRVTHPESVADVRASVRPLWKFFFLAAILLLFAEGLVSAALRRL